VKQRKETVRRFGVLVKLNESERHGLALLREREALPGAQVLRRLLVREVRQVADSTVLAK
jgi:hypothetical protein